MTATEWLEQLGFLLVALFTLGSALGVLVARRVLHAALWLLPTLVGVAAVYALLGAHLLFAMQLLIYVGAITVLLVFAVMLLEEQVVQERLPAVIRDRIPLRFKPATGVVMHYYGGMQHVLGGFIAAGLLFVVMIAAIAEAAWFQQWRTLQPEPPAEFAGDNVRYMGELLLTRYLLPFELVSVLLLVALVGAVVIARWPRRKARPEADEGESGADSAESEGDAA